jgi:hypothetical protein
MVDVVQMDKLDEILDALRREVAEAAEAAPLA